ncbi:hypothetical protein [Pseudarthrobacter sp. NIBRBAC000502771]|uniref:hypothetical protein n=1 Tax=Pseudarthrobacter sp. NIBRBAC000502771 TaxID=2590774 RepID=UPI00143D6229|nr:hypothetical protein [Pseudarthrobacter sp. NIBRBAC000502771]
MAAISYSGDFGYWVGHLPATTSSKKVMDFGRVLACEVAASLKQGDHVRHSNQLPRALFSFLFLLLIPLGGRRSLQTSSYAITIALANPVEHGSKLGLAVRKALLASPAAVMADRRLADSELGDQLIDFPSLTVRSLAGLVSFGDIWRAVKLRRRTQLVCGEVKQSRIYLELLFLLQAIRYLLAERVVAAFPRDHLLLTDFDRDAYNRPLVWHANMLGRHTATLVHGTPGKTYLPFLAQSVFVWGGSQAEWVGRLQTKTKVHVVGRPELSFAISAGKPARLRVVHSMERLTTGEVHCLREVCHAARKAGLDVSFRLHPSAPRDSLDGQWGAVIGDAEIEAGESGFLDSLEPGDLVVGVSSTAIVDAVAVGLPAWIVADSERQLPCDLEFLREKGGNPASLIEFLQSDGGSRGAHMLRLSSLRESLVAGTGLQSASMLRRAVKASVTD